MARALTKRYYDAGNVFEISSSLETKQYLLATVDTCMVQLVSLDGTCFWGNPFRVKLVGPIANHHYRVAASDLRRAVVPNAKIKFVSLSACAQI